MKIAVRKWNQLDQSERDTLLGRSEQDIKAVEEAVKQIVERVEKDGDSALRQFTTDLDHVDISNLSLRVSDDEIAKAAK